MRNETIKPAQFNPKVNTWERGWGALSAEDWGKGILPWTVNKQAGQVREALGVGKLVRVAEGGKLHRRGGKTHLPHEL
jgi:hypothetical protein